MSNVAVLDNILKLPRSGVVILTQGSRAVVTYSTNMGSQLEFIYNQFAGQTGVNITVCSQNISDLETLKLHAQFYRDYYKSIGFEIMLAPLRAEARCRVRMTPDPSLKFIDVELVNSRGSARFVGRFRSVVEAKDFIETCYGADNKHKFPVYAANTDTKVFLHKQTKILDIK